MRSRSDTVGVLEGHIARWLRGEEAGIVIGRSDLMSLTTLAHGLWFDSDRSNIVGRARAGRAALAGQPGAARPRSRNGAVVAPRVLTDLLTTVLDGAGQLRNDEPHQQDRCGRLDSRGRL
jgi:hypothetical protein